MFGLAFYFSRKESIGSYLINEKKSTLWMLTFSNVATLVGAGAIVAVVSEVYNTGISYGISLISSFILGTIILGIISYKIKDFGDKEKIYTIPDFFEKKYDYKNKILVQILQIFLLTIWIAIQAVAFAYLATALIGTEFHTALLFTAIITIFYTSIGGLKIDIISDVIQFWIIFIVLIILAIKNYFSIENIPSLISSLPKGHLNPANYAGWGVLIISILMAGLIYVSGTQHWQRIISARNKETARKSFLLTLPFILIISIITIFFGLIASVNYSGIEQDTALFILMKDTLNPIMLGFGLAAILAVIMSSLDSLLIGGSTILYNSLVKKNFSPKRKIFIARLLTALFGVTSFSIAFLIPDIVTLSIFQVYLALIFVFPILTGLYSNKYSSGASFWSILIGFISLIILFPFLETNTVLIQIPLSLITFFFYDKII
jgi:SSS family solute:Na+ symporter